MFKGFLDGPGSSTREDGTSKVRAPVNVVTTVARQSLGIEMRDIFEEGVHLKKDKKLDEVEGVYYAHKQMRWFLKKVRLPQPPSGSRELPTMTAQADTPFVF